MRSAVLSRRHQRGPDRALRKLLGLAALSCLLGLSQGAQAAPVQGVDVALVLAVDVSFSMDARELDLQRQGYVAALRSPEVMRAIRSGFLGRIAVTYVEWAGPGTQSVTVPWTIVDGPASAEALAARLGPDELFGRHGTAISSALLFAADLFAETPFHAQRRVIDVSGDGPNNMGGPVEPARDQVVGRGITINGLPLVLERSGSDRYSIPDLDRYYRACVIGGSGAFMIPVTAIEGFAEAVRRKLVLEIAEREPEPEARVWPVADLQDGQAGGQASGQDCMIGERLRGGWDRQR